MLIVLLHQRRRVVHFAVTEHPSAVWVSRQIRHAFPFDSAPRYLIRDRDSIYGSAVRQTLAALGIEEVLTAPRSPWQSPFVERLIGSLRRECLDQVIVLNELHLHRIASEYFRYYHTARAHLSLGRNAPVPRAIESVAKDRVVSEPMVGGLHHRYRRVA
jgi:putative transposase